jgi:hypothetical protein
MSGRRVYIRVLSDPEVNTQRNSVAAFAAVRNRETADSEHGQPAHRCTTFFFITTLRKPWTLDQTPYPRRVFQLPSVTPKVFIPVILRANGFKRLRSEGPVSAAVRIPLCRLWKQAAAADAQKLAPSLAAYLLKAHSLT